MDLLLSHFVAAGVSISNGFWLRLNAHNMAPTDRDNSPEDALFDRTAITGRRHAHILYFRTEISSLSQPIQSRTLGVCGTTVG